MWQSNCETLVLWNTYLSYVAIQLWNTCSAEQPHSEGAHLCLTVFHSLSITSIHWHHLILRYPLSDWVFTGNSYCLCSFICDIFCITSWFSLRSLYHLMGSPCHYVDSIISLVIQSLMYQSQSLTLILHVSISIANLDLTTQECLVVISNFNLSTFGFCLLDSKILLSFPALHKDSCPS
jgi:hypothetical protein